MDAPQYPRPATVDQLLAILSGFTHYEQNRDFHKGRVRCDLQNMRALCDAAGNPHLAVPCVHVTGSKGKGSTALMISAILRCQGFLSGTFTSPHLMDLRERIAVGGEALSEPRFVACADRVLDLLRRDGALRPTFFEFITQAAFFAFADLGVEAAVYEVGLGGRLDATNVVHPEAVVITTLEREHCAVLGESLEEIAREKAGIIKPGVPVVTAIPEGHPGRPVVERAAADAGARLLAPGRGLEIHAAGGGAIRVEVDGRGEGPFHPPPPRDLQAWNLACAVAASRLFVERLSGTWSGPAAQEGLERLRLPGRFEVCASSPVVVVDGAHTPFSVGAGLGAFRERFEIPPVVVLGIAEDKDLAAVLEAVLRHAGEIVFTSYDSSRSVPPERLRELAGGRGRTAAGCAEALAAARRAAGPDGGVLVTGSFYLAGEARRILLAEGAPPAAPGAV